jgi:deoxyxylulose-5-phosphate synthase
MESPVCIRYPRGVANMAKYETQDTIEIGKGLLVRIVDTTLFESLVQ